MSFLTAFLLSILLYLLLMIGGCAWHYFKIRGKYPLLTLKRSLIEIEKKESTMLNIVLTITSVILIERWLTLESLPFSVLSAFLLLALFIMAHLRSNLMVTEEGIIIPAGVLIRWEKISAYSWVEGDDKRLPSKWLFLQIIGYGGEILTEAQMAKQPLLIRLENGRERKISVSREEKDQLSFLLGFYLPGLEEKIESAAAVDEDTFSEPEVVEDDSPILFS